MAHSGTLRFPIFWYVDRTSVVCWDVTQLEYIPRGFHSIQLKILQTICEHNVNTKQDFAPQKTIRLVHRLSMFSEKLLHNSTVVYTDYTEKTCNIFNFK